MSLAEATWNSVNVVFAQLDLDVGPENVTHTAHQMGIEAPLESVPAEAIGGLRIGVTPLEMADAYATLASGGIHHEPTAVSKVEFPNGKVDETNPESGDRVLTEGEAYEVTKLLEGVITQGTGAGYTYMGCGSEAGKTGTSEGESDAWFAGYTPMYSTAVWVGHPQSREATGFGGPTAGPIWRSFMESAQERQLPRIPHALHPAQPLGPAQRTHPCVLGAQHGIDGIDQKKKNPRAASTRARNRKAPPKLIPLPNQNRPRPLNRSRRPPLRRPRRSVSAAGCQARTSDPASGRQQLVEADRRAAGQDEGIVLVQQARAGQVAHGSLDRVALLEAGGFPADVADQLGQGHLGRVEGEHVLKDGGLDRRVFGGGGADVVGLLHGWGLSWLAKGTVSRSLPPTALRSRRFVVQPEHETRPIRLQLRPVEVLHRAPHLLGADQLEHPAIGQHADVVADVAEWLVEVRRQLARADRLSSCIACRICRRSGCRSAASRSLLSERLALRHMSGQYRANETFCLRRVLSGVLAHAAHLAEDGGDAAVFALLVGDHVGDRVDQRQVGEGLGEVAEVAAALGLQLLGEEVEPAGRLEQPLAERAGPACTRRSPRAPRPARRSRSGRCPPCR